LSIATGRNQLNVCCINILESSFSERFSHWESSSVKVGLCDAQYIDAMIICCFSNCCKVAASGFTCDSAYIDNLN
jgi:hypothetical protein